MNKLSLMIALLLSFTKTLSVMGSSAPVKRKKAEPAKTEKARVIKKNRKKKGKKPKKQIKIKWKKKYTTLYMIARKRTLLDFESALVSLFPGSEFWSRHNSYYNKDYALCLKAIELYAEQLNDDDSLVAVDFCKIRGKHGKTVDAQLRNAVLVGAPVLDFGEEEKAPLSAIEQAEKDLEEHFLRESGVKRAKARAPSPVASFEEEEDSQLFLLPFMTSEASASAIQVSQEESSENPKEKLIRFALDYCDAEEEGNEEKKSAIIFEVNSLLDLADIFKETLSFTIKNNREGSFDALLMFLGMINLSETEYIITLGSALKDTKKEDYYYEEIKDEISYALNESNRKTIGHLMTSSLENHQNLFCEILCEFL